MISDIHQAREISDLCNCDIRTVHKRVFESLKELGFDVPENTTKAIEYYGEFTIIRAYSPTGRLMHLAMNQALFDLVLSQFSVTAAYAIRKSKQAYDALGGFIVNQLTRRYSQELILIGLKQVGLIAECAKSKSGYKYVVENLKNASGINEAYFIKVPTITLNKKEDPLLPPTVDSESRTLFVYGETAKRLMEYLIEHEIKHRNLYFSEI